MRHHLLLVAILPLALATGCDMLLDGPGASKEAESASPTCLAAQRCCAELEQVQVYDSVSASFERSNFWPNHCPSWKVQSDARCKELIDHVATRSATLEREHPVFDPELCRMGR